LEWIPSERAIILVLALWALIRLSQGIATLAGQSIRTCRFASIVAGIAGICVFALEYFLTFHGVMNNPDLWGDMYLGTGVKVCAISGGLLAGVLATLPKEKKECQV
jgi:hypothetical protein